jgi:hypothetical protein
VDKILTKQQAIKALQEIAVLEKGWYNGDGEDFTQQKDFMQYCYTFVEKLGSHQLYPFPNPAGGVHFEIDGTDDNFLAIDIFFNKSIEVFSLYHDDDGYQDNTMATAVTEDFAISEIHKFFKRFDQVIKLEAFFQRTMLNRKKEVSYILKQTTKT